MKTFVAVSLFVAFVAMVRADNLVELQDDSGKVDVIVSYRFCYLLYSLNYRPDGQAYAFCTRRDLKSFPISAPLLYLSAGCYFYYRL